MRHQSIITSKVQIPQQLTTVTTCDPVCKQGTMQQRISSPVVILKWQVVLGHEDVKSFNSSIVILFLLLNISSLNLFHRCRNPCGRSGHGLTTFLTCHYKAKSRVRQVISLPHPLLADAITCTIAIGTPWSVYCCASSEMSDAAVAVRPNCTSVQHSKVIHPLHKHLAWPLQFCFLRRCVWHTCCSHLWSLSSGQRRRLWTRLAEI